MAGIPATRWISRVFAVPFHDGRRAQPGFSECRVLRATLRVTPVTLVHHVAHPDICVPRLAQLAPPRSARAPTMHEIGNAFLGGTDISGQSERRPIENRVANGAPRHEPRRAREKSRDQEKTHDAHDDAPRV